MPSKKSQKAAKRNIFVLSCLFLLVVLVTWQTFRRTIERISNDFFHPFLDVPVLSEKYLSAKAVLLTGKNKLAFAVTRLNKENQILKVENSLLKKLQQENKALRAMMNLAKQSRYDYVFADIIIRDPISWNETFTVNKGKDHGLEVGFLVVGLHYDRDFGKTKMAVIGRVVDVTRHNARIVTIISPESRLSVLLPESKAIGILEGAGRRGKKLYAKVRFLPKSIEYKVGEEVVTTGLSKWTLPQLPVGRVADYFDTANPAKTDNDLYKYLYITPATDLDALTTVMIIKKKGQH